MKNPAHIPFQRGIYQLVLLHARFADELRRDDLGGPVIVIPGQIGHGHLGAGEGGGDHRFDFGGGHWHGGSAVAHQLPTRFNGLLIQRRANSGNVDIDACRR